MDQINILIAFHSHLGWNHCDACTDIIWTLDLVAWSLWEYLVPNLFHIVQGVSYSIMFRCII